MSSLGVESRASLADRSGGSIQLLAGTRLGPVTRNPKRVAGKARHHQEMGVEDVLAGAFAVGKEEVDALAADAALPDRPLKTSRDNEQARAQVLVEIAE
jgi:predicted ThiF/HesA family dinucleotide-utilizing enzyme